MTPPDLAALARDWIYSRYDSGSKQRNEELVKELTELLSLSRTAGRAEGLEEGAVYHDDLAEIKERAAPFTDTQGALSHRHHAKMIRALASDPAPEEQPAAYHGLGNAAISAGEPGTAYQSAAPGDQVAEERRAIADEARRYAGHYPQASDGRNTFILLAEWIEARGAAPAHPTEPGAQSESFSPETTNNENPFPAHPTEPGEVERLAGDLDEARQKLDLEHSEKEDSFDDLATALTGLDIYRARADILATENERLRAIETAAREVVACWGVGSRGETLVEHMIDPMTDLRAALSTPRPKGETE